MTNPPRLSISARFGQAGLRLSQFETWTYGLFNSAVVGGATSVTSWLGMAAAHGAGVDVPSLNWKSLGIMFLSGAAVKFFGYLSQGLPALVQTTDSKYLRTSPDGTTVEQSSTTTTTTPSDAPKTGLTKEL